MSRVLISFLAVSTAILGEVKMNDNITGKLSLFPVIVKNPSSFGPQAWVVWVDNRSPGKSYEIYVNGLTSAMTRWWNTDTVISRNYPGIDTFHGHRLSHTACSDDSGGIYIGYINHHRLLREQPPHYEPGIYIRRLKSDGTMWPKPCSISSSTQPMGLCSDGAGGVICAWMEKSGGEYKIMAKRLDSNGNPHPDWETNPVTVRSDTAGAKGPKVVQNIKQILTTGNFLVIFKRGRL